MTIQQQYASTVRQAQDTWTGVAESFTDNLQKSFSQSANVPGLDPAAAIDQVFDFWQKTLEVQRDIAKQMVGASVAVSETVRAQAESVGEAVRERVEFAKQSARQQAESAERVAHEQAAQKYDELAKAQLQDELAARDLPKTGTVDELRERLVAADEKTDDTK